jgi:hypothetical protein
MMIGRRGGVRSANKVWKRRRRSLEEAVVMEVDVSVAADAVAVHAVRVPVH